MEQEWIRQKDGTFKRNPKYKKKQYVKKDDGTFEIAPVKKTEKKKTTTQYKTKEAEEKAKQKSILDKQFSGLSYNQVQEEKKKYPKDSAEYKHLNNFTGYNNLLDFDEAIKYENKPFSYNGQRLTPNEVTQKGLSVPLANAPRKIDVFANSLEKNTKAIAPAPISTPKQITSAILNAPTQQAEQDEVAFSYDAKRVNELEVARNKHALDNKFDYYTHYKENEDYEEKSTYKPEKVKKNVFGNMKKLDEVYYYANADDKEKAKYESSFGMDASMNMPEELTYVKYMSDDELGVFNYLFNTDKEKAEEYFEDIKTNLSRRNAKKVVENVQNFSDDAPVTASVLSVPMSVLGGISGGTDTILSKMKGENVDYYGQAYGGNLISSTIRNRVGQNIAENTKNVEVLGTNVPSFLYQTAMSMGDTVLGGAMFGRGYSVIAGSSAYQSKARELYEAGEDAETIEKVAIASGLTEVVFEYMSLDKLLSAKSVVGKKQIIKNALSQAGVEASEELATEVSNIIIDEVGRGDNSNLSQMRKELEKQGYSDEEIDKKITQQIVRQVAEATVGGALSGGAMGGVYSSIGNSYTDTEQSFINDKVQERVDAKENESGKKVTKKERQQIQDDVVKELRDGEFSRDEIEKRFGGESYTEYQKILKDKEEYTSLMKMRNGDRTGEQDDRLYELRKMNNEKSFGDRLAESRSKLSDTVKNATGKSGMLDLTYGERGKRTQAFTVKEEDLNKYSEKEREIVQKAIDYGEMNNSRKAHEFVDLVAKLSADKGVSFDFSNNEKLKEAGFTIEGKTINGFKKGTSVTVNLQSKKALNIVVGHEITHVLEGTDLYTALQSTLKEYATSKGVYESMLETAKANYQNVYTGLTKEEFDAKIEQEVTADLVGDYIFSDMDFVRNLSTKNPNVFQKVYNEIKYMLKVATAGSDAEKQLLKAKKIFEDVYRDTKRNTSEETQYSIAEIVGDNGQSFGIGVRLDSTLLDGLSPKERVEMIKEYVHELGGSVFTAYDSKGNKADIRIAEKNKHFKNRSGKRTPVNNNLATKYINNETKQESITLIDELIDTAEYDSSEKSKYPHGWLDNNGTNDWEYWKTYVEDKNGTIWSVTLNVANTTNGEKVLYDINQIKKVGQSVKSDTIPTSTDTISEVKEDVKRKYSLSDNKGNTLTEAQQERYKNSKVRDENGNLKLMYHGTQNDFTVFDPMLQGGKNGIAEGYGIYFTDNEKVANNYGGKKMSGYVNITHPATIYEKTISKSELVKLIKATTEIEAKESVDFGEYDNVQDALKDTWVSNYVYTYDMSMDEAYREVADIIKNGNENDMHIIQEVMLGIGVRDYKSAYKFYDTLRSTLGIDGFITEWVDDKTNEKSEVAVAFDSNQFKAITNQNPTDNPDINMSLSDNQSIAPIKNGIYSEDVLLERPIAPIREDHSGEVTEMVSEQSVESDNMIAPLKTSTPQVKSIAPPIAPVQTEQVENDIFNEMYAPVTEEEANAMLDSDENWERMRSLQEAEEPQEIDEPAYDNDVQVNDPFEDRDIKEVGKRNVNAYMYDNPEVKPFYQEEARIMLGELQNTVKGERFYNDQLYYDTNGEQGFSGTSRMTSDEIAELLDNYKYSYAEIEKGLKAIIEDHGAENIAVAKRIEFFLNERLLNGHTDFQTGIEIPRNQDYVNLLESMQVNESHNVDIDLAPSINFGNLETTDRPIAPVREVHASEPLPLPTGNEVRGVRMNAEQKQGTPRTTERGNLRSWAETSTESEVVNREILPKDLDQSKIYYEPISNRQTLNTANSDLNRMGYDKALEVFNAKLENRTVSLSDIALGERLVQESLKRGDTKTTGELIQNIAILGTELGQKVQALSIIQRMTPEGQLKMLQKVVNRGKAKGDKVFDNVEITQEMIDKILAVYGQNGTYDQNKLNEAVEQVKQEIADQMSVSVMDKVNAWRYLAMLGNPKTHIRNVVSNITMQATTEIKDVIARTTETIAPIKNRTKTWKVATEDVKKFAKQSTAEAKEVLTSENSYSEVADIKAKREIFKTQILQKVYDFNNDWMTKEDWFFKKSRYRRSLQEFLTANGIKTQEDIQNNPELVEKGKKYATEQAQIATFQQVSWLANEIRKFESKNVATQIGVGAVIPFKKTPINIAKTGLAYSPLSFGKTLLYDIPQMKKGNMEASQVVDNLAKGVTGSALVYIGYLLAMSGFLSGGGEDDKESKYDYQLGEQYYSLNIDGNTYTLNWLSPVAMPLFVGANFHEAFNEDKEFTWDTTLDSLSQTLDPMTEMSFLSGLTSVMSSYEQGTGAISAMGETMLQNYVTQFVPTLFGQVAQVTDDTKRNTQVAGDSNAKAIEQTINKLKYKIPVLRQTLEPTIDIWGNEVKQTEDMIGRAVETFIAPYTRKDSIATEIDEEIKEVYSQTGENSVIPTVPNKKVQFKGETYKMSAKEYTDYKTVYGQLANETLEDLFRTSTYQNSDADYKAELLSRAYKYASDEAKKDYLAKEGVEYTNTTEDNVPVYKTDKIKGAIDNDMTLEEFDLYNRSHGKYYISQVIGGYDTYKSITSSLGEIESDKKANGSTINGSRKKKVVQYLNNANIDYYTKIIMFKAEYPADDRYNSKILEYIKGLDMSYQEKIDTLTELGFKVTSDGKIRW